ncbi:MAG: hypothetical protein H6607_11625 [Flavobacteriales bacterium]|nr:hypothetical protein [Flavobacteriales bacterium]
MNTIELFKNDLWNGIWQHAKRLFKPLSLFVLAYTIILVGLVFFMMSKLIGIGFSEYMQMSSGGDLQDILDRSAEMNDNIAQNMANGGFLIVIVFLLVIWAFASWIYNFLLMVSHEVLENGSASIGNVFAKSFNKKVLLTMGFLLMIFVMYLVGILLSTALAAVHPILMFLGIIVLFVFLTRFLGGIPAIVHGDMGVMDSINYSFRNIDWVRAIKIVLILIAFFIVYILFLLLMGSITNLMGSAGSVLGVLVSIFVAILMAALSTSALSATFYRYAEVEYEDSETKHLIDDNF